MSAGTPEDGDRSEVAERLLGELRLAEGQERAAKERHDAERMAETEAAYGWRRKHAAAARKRYREFFREPGRGDR